MSTDPGSASHPALTIDVVGAADETPTLRCAGRITAENSKLFKSKVQSVAPGHLYLDIDLFNVDFVDSSGLGEVVAAYVSARSAGCRLNLIKVNPRVKDLLDVTRLAPLFEKGSIS